MGNSRVTVNDIDSIVTKDDYYPFGLQMPGRSYNIALNSSIYKYAGKELDEENGLDWYYFGARYYDPAIARWMSVDPLANKFPSWSPYNYVYNNPLNAVDPNGEAGLKINFDVAVSGGIFNATGGIGIGYDWDKGSLIVEAHGGFGGASFTKGMSGGQYTTVEYFSGTISEEPSGYIMGVAGNGVGGQVKATLPIEDINKVEGILPTASEIGEMSGGDIMAGAGPDGGASVAAGIEGTKILLDVNLKSKKYLDLNNQTGQAPADASNVRVIKPDEEEQ